MAWAAVRAVARRELRRCWLALTVLGLLAGLSAGVVASAAAMAHRTGTAHDRLVEATHLDDARVAFFGQPEGAAELADLPMVRTSWSAGAVVGQVVGRDSLQYVSLLAGPRRPPDLITPVVIHGRAPDPADPHEILIAEDAAGFYGASVGSTLDLALLTPAEFLQFDTGFGDPDGPRVGLRITGIARMTTWGDGFGPLLGTPAFADRYQQSFVGSMSFLRLDGSADAGDRLTAAVDRLSTSRGAEAAEFGPLRAEFPRDTDRVSVQTSERVLVTGLLVFAGLVALAGLLATMQGLARHHAGGAGDQEIESALGLTVGERIAARVLPATLGALTAAVATAAVALSSAGLEPLGALRRYEPQPGWMPNADIITAAALAVAVVFLLTSALTARRAARTSLATGRVLGASRPGTVLRPAWLHAGMSFGLRNDGRRGTAPVLATIAGAAVGIAGVVAAGTFAGALHRLSDTPARYGWTASFGSMDAKPQDLEAYQADDRIDAVDLIGDKRVPFGNDTVPVLSYEHRKGTLEWTLLDGRLPTRPGEIALGPQLAEDLAADVGRQTRLTGVRLDVVGIVLAPTISRLERGGRYGVTTPATLEQLGSGAPTLNLLVHVADPARVTEVRDDYIETLELVLPEPPQDVRTLTELGRLPDVLGLVLALVAAAAVGNALVVTARRRRHELAVLRTIGFTPRDVAAAVLTMGVSTALVALLIGVPLGLGLGRVVWYEVATSASVAGDMLVPGRLLALLVPAAVAVAAVVATIPAARAARLRPATVLRTE